MKENVVLSQILQYLSWKGILAWRNNSGLIFVQGRRLQLAPAGSPDIIGMTKAGRFLGIECKGIKGKQSDNQIAFEEKILKNNGLYILAHSIDEVEEGLKNQ